MNPIFCEKILYVFINNYSVTMEAINPIKSLCPILTTFWPACSAGNIVNFIKANSFSHVY
jgi:hypothetical protein